MNFWQSLWQASGYGRWWCLLLGLWLTGCSNLSPIGNFWPLGQTAAAPAEPGVTFKIPERAAEARLLPREELALMEEELNPVYQLGHGDILQLTVYGRPEVTGRHVIGPDGKITVPLVGDVMLNGLTREAALETLQGQLRQYFTDPRTTLSIEEYTSNQITVLGRVERAGRQRFPHPPTLVEVLAGAGAMPILDKQATLTRCAILRGRDKLIWVDLKALLSGDPAYNMRMKKGDIIFIPDSADTSVYVLGAVLRPGSYRLTPRMTVLDALAQAGGLNEDADRDKIGIYRAGAQQAEILSFADLIDPTRRVNYSLNDGDVVFLANSTWADIGYYMRQFSPAITIFTFGLTLKKASTSTTN